MAYKKLKEWFDKELAQVLAKKILISFPKFNSRKFIKAINKEVPSLELKDRVELFADHLHSAFNNEYTKGLEILLNILGPENKEETGMFTNFYWLMPVAKYVEKYGLNDFKSSMKAIEEITKRNTGEYAIRPYLVKYPNKTISVMTKWSKSKNSHVRRLASEGLRPRLPWAQKLDQFITDPKPIIPILNNLKDDTSKYVQKSVANCLNDILKDNINIGQKIIEKWQTDHPTKQRRWIIKHALRNLLKQENAWAQKMIK